jgi:histidyl-tRNA synthetase
MEKLSTESYKGVRDFYPRDMALMKHIFGAWRSASEAYGYEQYDASVMEPTEMYLSKTSEEIVREQTYTFIDRGDRSVTLRPEMTPTVSRMIAGKYREIPMPAPL